MKTVGFIGRKLSANQRQSMERIKYIEQQELQAKQAFNQSINQTIKKVEENTLLDEIEDLYKFRLDRELSFNNGAAYCLAHDEDFIDHTRGIN